MRKVTIPLAILALIGLDQWVKRLVVGQIFPQPSLLRLFLAFSA